jgi:Zn-finger nucleic acid-binding protein
MRCTNCGTAIEARGFPGGTIPCERCSSNVEVVAPWAESGNPYRDPAPQPVEPPSSNRRREVRPLCPRCARGLAHGNDSTLVCGGCGGAFVDHRDLAARIACERPPRPPAVPVRHATSPPPEPTVRYGRCPTCSELMTRVNFGQHSGILVDMCREHGTWFDRGELDSALAFVRAGGLLLRGPG